MGIKAKKKIKGLKLKYTILSQKTNIVDIIIFNKFYFTLFIIV